MVNIKIIPVRNSIILNIENSKFTIGAKKLRLLNFFNMSKASSEFFYRAKKREAKTIKYKE